MSKDAQNGTEMELKEMELKVTTYSGILPLSKLIDQNFQAKFKEKVGTELRIPMAFFAFGKDYGKVVSVAYSNPKDYEEGKCTIVAQNSEDIKDFYNLMAKILSSAKEKESGQQNV
jgi:hypothetical protein